MDSGNLLTNAYQRRLLKRWKPILESGKTIESTSTKVALAQILENTRNFYKAQGLISEAGVTQAQIVGSEGSGFGPDGVKGKGVMTGQYSVPYSNGDPINGYGDYYLPNVVIPMLRRIMPDLMANELVAVQPLNAPVGYALAYRPTYNDNGIVGDGKLKTKLEIGYAPTDARYSGVSADNQLTADDLTGFWDAYAGDYSNQWNGEGAPLGEKSEYADINNGTYPTVSFGLVKSAVEAKTRKLAAHWSPELAEDMQAMHGIDVEREMVNTLTYEIGAEIDRQIITEMVKAAIIGKSTTTWSPATADGLDQMGRLATLLTQITIEANQIAIRTRRGNANFVVTTPRVCALLQQLSMNKFTSFKTSATMPTVPDTGVGALAKVGLVNDD